MDRRRLVKLATIPVAIVIALLAARSCQAELADVTVRFDRGDGPAIRSIRAELYRSDDPAPVARFERQVDPAATGTLARWTLQIDPGTYELAVEVEPLEGAAVSDRRTIDAEARATVSIDLARSFSPGAR